MTSSMKEVRLSSSSGSEESGSELDSESFAKSHTINFNAKQVNTIEINKDVIQEKQNEYEQAVVDESATKNEPNANNGGEKSKEQNEAQS